MPGQFAVERGFLEVFALAVEEILVADDGGGSIFRRLEQGGPEYADSFDRVFLTPQSVDLAAVAGALGWRVAVVTDEAGLAEALAGDAEFVVAKVRS